MRYVFKFMKKLSEQLLESLSSLNIDNSEVYDNRVLHEVNKFQRNSEALQSIVESKDFLSLLLKVEELLSDQQELKFRMDPPVYLTKFKERTGIYSIIARTNWPLRNGKRKSISVYVGKFDEFAKGTNDPGAMKIAREKMIVAIREKYPMK